MATSKFDHPYQSVLTNYEYNGFVISVDYPTLDVNRKPSRFEVYLYTCLKGRTYRRVSSNGEILEITSKMKGKANVSTTVKALISRTEKVNMQELIRFHDNDEKLLLPARKTATDKNMKIKDIWVEVAAFSIFLPDPCINIYKIGNTMISTSLTRYENLNMNGHILDRDVRMKNIQEMFPFGLLALIHKEASFLLKETFYEHLVKPRKGVTFAYIDHVDK
jgi:hypothetical protein